MKNIQELEKPLEDVDYDKCYKKMEVYINLRIQVII